MNNPSSPALSFDDLFGHAAEDVSLERLEAILEQVVLETFSSSGHAPHELVHVVDVSGIRWMTAADVEVMLRSQDENSDAELRKRVQDSLRGTSLVLARELKVLLILAQNTLKRYRFHNLIPQTEVQRVEPNLMRMGRQVCYLLGELHGVECRIRLTRQKNPILSDFETKMGQLLQLQKQGLLNEAYQLAQILAGIKNKYYIASRSLTSDNNQSMKLRLELQGQKKSLLSCQRYLAAQRQGVLQTEIQDIRKTVENLKILFAKSSLDKQMDYQQRIGTQQTLVEQSQNELQVVQKAQQVLIREEKITDTVIQHFQEQLQDETAAESTTSKTAERHSTSMEPSDKAVDKSSSARRMASIDTKRR